MRSGINVLFLQLAAIQDPDWGPGIPWFIAPAAFEEMELLGLIERRSTNSGQTFRAVITDQGAAALERMRLQMRERKARRAQEAAHG